MCFLGYHDLESFSRPICFRWRQIMFKNTLTIIGTQMSCYIRRRFAILTDILGWFGWPSVVVFDISIIMEPWKFEIVRFWILPLNFLISKFNMFLTFFSVDLFAIYTFEKLRFTVAFLFIFRNHIQSLTFYLFFLLFSFFEFLSLVFSTFFKIFLLFFNWEELFSLKTYN